MISVSAGPEGSFTLGNIVDRAWKCGNLVQKYGTLFQKCRNLVIKLEI